jgi:hypothetical protein
MLRFFCILRKQYQNHHWWPGWELRLGHRIQNSMEYFLVMDLQDLRYHQQHTRLSQLRDPNLEELLLVLPSQQ